MGEHRIEMTADPEQVRETVAAFQGLTEAQHDHFLHNVVEVVLTYKTSHDPTVLTQFADDLLATAELRRTMPAYRTAFAS